MAQQVTRYATEQQRQIDTVLESVQNYASQVSRQLENQDVVLQTKLGSVMHDIGSEMQERMQKSADEINVSTLKAPGQVRKFFMPRLSKIVSHVFAPQQPTNAHGNMRRHMKELIA